MALAAATVWEVRTAGSDTLCSGGYVTGSAGTDYSQQNAAQYNAADLAIDAVTNTKVTSASHNFVTADVGNLLRITAGTGYTTGFYQIVSVAANAATLDRSPGAVGITGGTYYVGGALASPGLAVANLVAGHTIYASGGYTTTTDTANVAGGKLAFTSVAGAQATMIRFIGYGAARGDGTKYTITLGAGLVGRVIQTFQTYNEIRNIAIVGNATSAAVALYHEGRGCRAVNIKISGFSGGGANICTVTTDAFLKDFEISGGTTGTNAALAVIGPSTVMDGWVHGNAGRGISMATNGPVTFIRVASTDHTGANGLGWFVNWATNYTFMECVEWGNAAAGWYMVDGTAGTVNFIRCVSGGSGTYNWYFDATYLNIVNLYYCAAKTNTTALYPATPAINVGLVTLTGDPFTDHANGDFSPDNTTNEGAALRGVSEVIFGLTTTYADIGPAEHQPAAAGGSGPNIIVSSGAASRGASW